MKKLITLIGLLSLLASCGNPHIEGGPAKLGRSGGSQTTEPDDSETTGGSTAGGSTTGGTSTGGTTGGTSTGGTSGGSSTGGTTGGDFVLYVGDAASAHSGIVTTGFASEVNLESATIVDFNSFKSGAHLSLQGDEYLFVVQSEKIHSQVARTTLAQIFGNKLFRFGMYNPVTQNHAVGKDMGVSTLASDTQDRKMATIWKFKKAISFWGATLVDVESIQEVKAILRLYDCNTNLLKEIPYVYPHGETGSREIHFLGFKSPVTNICAVSLTVGDNYPADDSHGPPYGAARALALDDFVFGR